MKDRRELPQTARTAPIRTVAQHEALAKEYIQKSNARKVLLNAPSSNLVAVRMVTDFCVR